MKCSFDRCEKEVCDEDKDSPDRMKFCQEHHDELKKYAIDGDAKAILGFWIKANGGAKKLAQTF